MSVTGDPENPEISLSATGPAGALAEQDIVTLLTAGMTYGELQQFDSTALGSVAGSYLGQWLARSIRDDVGLDALQFTPDFSSDSTSLVVNAGKYVLPDLFVSYSSDVFSSDAGTIRAQYFINRDFFLEAARRAPSQEGTILHRASLHIQILKGGAPSGAPPKQGSGLFGNHDPAADGNT